MNSDHEHRLERAIDRELKALPDLEAPPTLAGRVLRALAAQVEPAWYLRPWQTWPAALRAACMLVLLSVFAALCFGAWMAPRTNPVSTFVGQATAFLGSVGALRDALNVLGNVTILLIRHLGTGVLIGCAAGATLAYFLCVGLGTVCVRLAFARR